jgi:NAD(P)-dependent dehydrogenase (short-subunit alcohol dehydrogenase family)
MALSEVDQVDEFRSVGALRPKLRGRVAFVTGGTRGIGAAISKSLAGQGATLAAGYGRNTEQAQKFLKDLSAAADGVDVSVHQGDIANPDDCRRTIREVIDLHGRLDILVNNAGGAGAVAGYAVLRVDPAVIAPDAREAPAGQSAMPPASLTTPAGSDSALAFG